MPRQAVVLQSQQPQMLSQLQGQLQQIELELQLQEAQYAKRMLSSLLAEDRNFVDGDADRADRAGWLMTSSGGNLLTPESKDLQGQGIVLDPGVVRRQSYRMWRLNPHARGVLRALQKYIIGRDFKMDPADLQRGTWNADRTKLTLARDDDMDAPLLVMEVWKDFAKKNKFLQRAKELVRRTFRDGEMFVRKFENDGHVTLRFVEPDHVKSDDAQKTGTVKADDGLPEYLTGKPTTIQLGIEHLAKDWETVAAYYVKVRDTDEPERVPIKEMIHLKCQADANDLRGFPFLEPVLRRLTNYEQWEEYRMVLNKMRTAVALVRKVEGTKLQGEAIVAGRLPARPAPLHGTPQTEGGRREAMFKPGTILTPGPGVSYDFTSPNLDAKDASEDGRRFLLSVAAGVGMPEMLVTGDYSNANFASTSEAMAAVQREWEDWQDFFEPAFVQIWEWVMEAAKDLGLPEETDLEVALGWPTVIVEDKPKATERRATLNASSVLSKKTWAAQEGLVWDDEIENLRDEAEQLGETPPGDEPVDGDPLADRPGASAAAGGATQTPPSRRQRQRTAVEEGSLLHQALGTLAELEETASQQESPEGKAAMEGYLTAVRRILLGEAAGRGGEGMQVQSLLFDKKQFTPAQAKAWAKKHGFSASKVDVTSGSVRLRQRDPGQFSVMRTISMTTGVKAVVGK